MIDFAVVTDSNGNYDISTGSGLDFSSVDDFSTLFQYQLNCDRRGTKLDTSIARSRGGWAGDLITKQNGYESGSYLWTKLQSRNTTKDINEIAGIADEALKYFTDSGLAESVTVTVNNGMIEGTIKIDDNITNKYLALWQNIIY